MKKFVLLILLFAATNIHATTIRYMSLEEMAVKSDLVALVEVTKAGGIYAEYKIIQSIKGQKEGNVVIYTPPGPHGPFFPVVLVGDRYVVLACKDHNLTQMTSSSSSAPNIMAWREIPYDYRLPLWQGKLEVNSEKDATKVLARANSFIQKTKEQQRLYFLRQESAQRLGGIPYSRARLTVNVRCFLVLDKKDAALQAFGNLTTEEKHYLNMKGIESEEEVMQLHDLFVEREKINEYDRLVLLDDQSFEEKWKSLKAIAQKDSKETYEQMIACEKSEAYYFGESEDKKVLELTPENAEEFEKKLLYIGFYEMSELLCEFKNKKITLKSETVNAIFKRLIDAFVPGKDSPLGIDESLRHGMPTDKKELIKLIKQKGLEHHKKEKLCLLAFLGDEDGRRYVEENIRSVNTTWDHDWSTSSEDTVAVEKVAYELHALFYYDREKFISLAANAHFFEHVAVKLYQEDAHLYEKKIRELFTKMAPAQKSKFIRKIDPADYPELYQEFFEHLPFKQKLERTIEKLRFSGRETMVDEKMLMEIQAYEGKDSEMLSQAFYLLASTGNQDFLPFTQKHQQVLAKHPYFLPIVRIFAVTVKDKQTLVKLLNSDNPSLRLMALNYLLIVDEKKYMPQIQKYLESEDLEQVLQAAICLAERGVASAVDVLLDKLPHVGDKFNECRDSRIFIDNLSARLTVLFSNMSQGKTNKMSLKEIAEYWEKNRKSYRDPWRTALDKSFCE